MVAYSFKRRFALPITTGEKAQTIRGNRKRHARSGEQVQLYTGMRTRQCRLLGRSPCLDVQPVRLGFHREHGPGLFIVGGRCLSADEMEAFARADGFGESGYAVLDMCAFWFEAHGEGRAQIDFEGILIRWQPLIPLHALDVAEASSARCA